MIGRGAQGQPWLPGQIARRLDGGTAEVAPALTDQLSYVSKLYDDVLNHYGATCRTYVTRASIWAGLWMLLREGASASTETLKRWRQVILTATDPVEVRRSLQDAFSEFAWSKAA